MDDLNLAGAYADKQRVEAIFDDLDKLSERFAAQLRVALFGKDHPHDDLHLFTKLQAEMLILAVHLTDRIEFQPLGSAREDELNTALYDEIEEKAPVWLWHSVKEHLDERLQEYARWPDFYVGLTTDSTDCPLFLKFAEVVTAAYGVSTPASIDAVAKIGPAFFRDVRRNLSLPSMALTQ